MADNCPKVYWNGILLWCYQSGNRNLNSCSVAYSTPHKLSNATGYTGAPYNWGLHFTNYPNIPSPRKIQIAYNYQGRGLKFWTASTTTPGTGSSAPNCFEVTPDSQTWDDNLGWVYEVTWPDTSDAFIITEDGKYEKNYSYQNVHPEGVTYQYFYPRWDRAYNPNENSYIMYKTSSDWKFSTRYIRKYNGTSWTH